MRETHYPCLQYLALQNPLYERRHAIVSGTAQPTPEEVEAGEEQSIKDDPDYTRLPKDVQPAPAGIPEFWLTALRTHVHLGEIITDRDAEALKALTDVRIEYLPSAETKPGFKLLFVFGPNDFFENEVLEKTYLYQEEVGYSGDFMYDRAIGTEIKWKEDKDLTKEFEVKKQRNKSESDSLGIRLFTFVDPLNALFFTHQTRTGRDWSGKRGPRRRSSTSSRHHSRLPTKPSRMGTSKRTSLRSSRRSSRSTTSSARISRKRCVGQWAEFEYI